MSVDSRSPGLSFFIPSLDGGGAERVVVNLANSLAARGHCTDILLFHRRGEYLDQVAPAVDVFDLQASGPIGRWGSLAACIRYCRGRKPRVLVVSGHSAYLVACMARLFCAFKLVVVVHNTVSRESGFSRLVAKYLYRFASRVVAVSQGVCSDIREYAKVPQAKLTTIYNPVDVDTIVRMASEQPEHPWFTDGGKPPLVSVGSLSKQKNHALLIRALRKARERVPDLRLIILGEGREREHLEKLVTEAALEEAVSLPGFKANPFAFMQRGHRFVLASRHEGFGLVLVEALASGAKVIATDCPSGPSEILKEGRLGLLVPNNDEKALMESLLQGEAVYPSSEVAQNRARDFSLDQATDLYERLINDL